MADLTSFLQVSHDRGFLNQCTDLEGLKAHLSKGPCVAYLGFDATANSVHIGNLVGIMWLRWLQKCGHKPVVLLGDGTTKVGDPSGRDKTRPILTAEQIDKNVQGIAKVFERYLTFGDGATDAILVRNESWLKNLPYLEFLQNYGRHFSINRMMSFDSVRLRLEREQPLTFIEFNYMILQAYDFYHLFKTQNCALQLGGADQWGNIINGVELIRRTHGKTAYGMTTSLITTSDGDKMGKSAGGAVWLNEDKLPHYDFWQYWRNVTDQDVGRFLRLFTELPLEEIQKLETLKGSDVNQAKKILADEVTRLARGNEAVQSVNATVTQIFEKGSGSLDELPKTYLAKEKFVAGVPIVDLLCQSGLTKTRGEARRLIRGGGARLNDEVVKDENLKVGKDHMPQMKLSYGRKKHALVVASSE